MTDDRLRRRAAIGCGGGRRLAAERAAIGCTEGGDGGSSPRLPVDSVDTAAHRGRSDDVAQAATSNGAGAGRLGTCSSYTSLCVDGGERGHTGSQALQVTVGSSSVVARHHNTT
jgi:hypothetical protein